MASLRLHHRVDVKRSCEWALLTGLILLPAWAQGVDVEQRPPAAQKMEQRIAQEVEAARVQEQRGMEPLKLGRLWAQLASDYEDEMQYPKSELAYNRALRIWRRRREESIMRLSWGILGRYMYWPGTSQRRRGAADNRWQFVRSWAIGYRLHAAG